MPLPSWNLRPWRQWMLLGLLLVLQPFGSAQAGDIQLSRLAQKQRHHELIRILQPKVDAKEPLSTFNLLLLAGAYFQVRDYRRLEATVALMEARIAQGDRRYFGDLSVYPALLRGEMALDLGDPARAAREGAGALSQLLRGSPQTNAFHESQLIGLSGLMGVAQAQLGHAAEADRHVAVLRGLELGSPINAPERAIALAKIHMAKREFPQALAAIQDPKAKVPGLLRLFYDQSFQDLPKLFILTKCLYETGRLKEGRQGYDQLLKHAQIREIGPLHWLILLDRARIARGDGQAALAESLLRLAVDVIEGQRASIQTEAGRIGYVGDKQEVYQELIALLVAAQRPGEAFEYVERAKGRALVDLLASEPLRPRGGGDLARLDHVERESAVLPDPELKPSQTRGLAVSLRQELAAAAPELASLVLVTPSPRADLQRALAEDETLLEFFACGATWYAFTVTSRDIQVKVMDLPGLKAQVEAARRVFANPAAEEAPREAESLHRLLLEPLGERLQGARLTLVPHGVLHYLPFAALTRDGQPLLERFSLRILPSASLLRLLKPAKAVQRSLILGNPDLGDPALDLAFAQQEAEALSRILPDPTLLLRGAATAAALARQGTRFDLIHLAAHGVFEAQAPLKSALFLARDGRTDGLLRVSDLYGLSLDADLVTLSACETGLAQVTTGDDVVGFTRGLLYAGARSIVSSLWKVDDRATQELMVAFYRGLAEHPKAEALRRAQLEVRRTHPHPFYWAAFQLTGNAR